MMRKSFFASRPALALAAILAIGSLSLATDVSAKGGGHGGGGGGGHGGGGGGSHSGGGGSHSGGLGGGGGGLRSGAVRSGGFTAHPGVAVRSGAIGVHRGVAFHRPFIRHRFFHRGFRVYPYYGCYRWRRVLTPFGWRLRRMNVCSPYYRQNYY